MILILMFIFSFLTAFCFAFVYDAPKRLFVPAGLCGGCGYIVYHIATVILNVDSIYASLLGSFTLGILSHIMARLVKSPVILFMIPGIIPLVPGSIFFKAAQKLLTLDFVQASDIFIRATLIAGAIAVGLLFSDQIAKSFIRKPVQIIKPKRKRIE
ncbi:threonine/serine exporter family protein [Staphylococcus chromogenes]|uniref:threonine/serine exporter family protein n=1 Tax=Staphylococcus chromogenes TaxID=46126 RepID=UPI000D0452FC|nr:threonine/serine exporter family protein [Staphylococcus chromogenes]MCD8904483.1 threonine/serine exporter family protein [Staphylococcus chromogenes]MEB7824463.1 threonine/serine exporter family protein [Staphylococcus chromogenes]UXS67603.1 threonine/serine exporter family protein [Staphylococcus chromogenes]